MTEVSFVDTNVLVYTRDPRDPQKRDVATELLARLWRQRTGRTSIQVLSEYYATVTRKLNPKVDPDDAWDNVLMFMTWNPQASDQAILKEARDIERRYHTNGWDASIVAAAQAQRCTILLSEDFQDGMVFGQLKVRNPFVPRVQEPHAEYQVKLSPRPLHRARGRPAKATL